MHGQLEVFEAAVRSGGVFPGQTVLGPFPFEVERRFDPGTVPAILAAQQRIEKHLAGEGRVVLRASGTEPVIRVMVEGRDEAEVRGCADELAQAVRAAVPRGPA